MLTLTSLHTEGTYAYHLHGNQRQGDKDTHRDHGCYLRDPHYLGHWDQAGSASELVLTEALLKKGQGAGKSS